MAPGGVEPPHADSKSAALSTELRGRFLHGSAAAAGSSYIGRRVRPSLSRPEPLADTRREERDDVRVELGSAEALQLRERLVLAERDAVGARRGHRRVGVANGQDPSRERDLVARARPDSHRRPSARASSERSWRRSGRPARRAGSARRRAGAGGRTPTRPRPGGARAHARCRRRASRRYRDAPRRRGP
jgi:hypothetical protein